MTAASSASAMAGDSRSGQFVTPRNRVHCMCHIQEAIVFKST